MYEREINNIIGILLGTAFGYLIIHFIFGSDANTPKSILYFLIGSIVTSITISVIKYNVKKRLDQEDE